MDGNKVQSNDFLQLLLAVKRNTMKDTHVATLCVVSSIDNTTKTAKCRRLNERNIDLICIVPYDMTLQQGDVVCVIFTDDDVRINLSKIQNGSSYSDVDTANLHSLDCGIIIKIIHRTVIDNE